MKKGDSMKTAICDDSLREVTLLGEMIGASGLPIDTDAYDSGNALLAEIQRGTHYDAVFLDIDMPEISGLELARMIRQHTPKTMIVFVTGYPQYAVDAFDCEAFHYLLKPVSQSKVTQVLERMMQCNQEQNRFYILKIRQQTIRVPICDICYIECCQRHVLFHTRHTVHETVGNLKTVYKELRPFGFLQIHQGYLVNMALISHFDGFDVVLSDGKRVPMSVRKRAEVLSAYARYIEVH